MSDTNALDALIQSLRRLPGVGVKSAQRMAFHLLQHDREGARRWRARCRKRTQRAPLRACHTFTEAEVCSTCLDPGAMHSKLCVVETPADQSAWSARPPFKGLYFVLMGKLSPLDGIGPKEIGCRSCSSAPPTARCRR
jgi:recombination protein RecR